MHLTTRTLDVADLRRSFDLRGRAFGPLPESARSGWEDNARAAIEAGRALGVYDGDLLVGRSSMWDFRQFWHGRVIPMAGVAGVAVAPEYRNRGVGTVLMDATIQRGRELGYLVSALYPATVPVYRSRGWEVAGVQHRVTVATRLLRDLRRDGPARDAIRQAGSGDAVQMVATAAAAYAEGRDSGVRDVSADELAEELDGEVFGYLGDDGFVTYGWEGKELVVYSLVAGSPDTARALWAVVGSSASVAEKVSAYLAPDDPLHALLGETVGEDVQQVRWMLRLLDVRAAVAARGFPAVDVDVPVVLSDDQVPENCLTGRLQVHGGRGELVDDDAAVDAVRLSANGMAALYAGTSVRTLARAGLAGGGSPEDLDALDAAFATRPAYLLDYF